MKLIFPFLCLLSSTLFAQTHPQLLMSPQRLTEIQAAVGVSGSSHEEMLQILQADVDANKVDIIDGGDRSLPGRNYARGFLGIKAAMIYAVTGNATYADIAFDALEAMYTDPLGGNVLPDGLDGKGLERANVGKAYAVTYDLAYNGWSTAQRDFVKRKIQDSLDYWQGAGARFDNDMRPYASNWNAVVYGSQILQMIAIGEQGSRSGHLSTIISRLNEHMSHYGDKGWTQEGNFYMTFAQQYLIPAIYAMQQKGDTRLNTRLAEKGMFLIPMYGGVFDADQSATQWGVGGNNFGTQGWTSMIFSIVPENMKGAYRYFYDRHRGILNDAPAANRYDPNHAGTVYAMMFYPESVPAVNPGTLLPSGLADDKGGYWFRNRWQDADDMIVSLGTDTLAHDNAWDEADAMQVNILGFGERFSGGPGTSRDARFFSQVTVDGQARSSQSGTGSAEFFTADATGGYAIAGGGSKFGGLGVNTSRRHLFVSYPDADEIAIVSTFDSLRSEQLREYAWQLNKQNLPLFTGEENGVPTFTLRGEEGAYLKGWILHPAGGQLSRGNSLTYTLEGNNVDIWVVMAMGKGSAPEARINGTGLNAELTLGRRLLRWNGGTNRIESDPVNHPVPGFTLSPLSGTAPLTASFIPAFTGGNPHWDFGDGTTSTANAPTHTFQNGGVIPITLTQDDGAGGRLSATHYLNVINNSPLAIMTATPVKGDPDLWVSFDATASSDPDGHPLSYTWDFGDGSPAATGAQVTHTYSVQGTYFASVTVEDGHGGVGGAVQRIEVGNQAPTPDFAFSSSFGIPPVAVDFDASGSSDPESDALSYSWDFGDGATASGVSPSHTYTQFGTFNVVLSVDDGQGNLRSLTRTLRIQNLPPTPQFTFTPNSGNAPQAVTFDASSSSDPEGSALTFAWDFGDGATGSGVSPSHTYSEAMNTQVQLTVTDAQGGTSTTLKPISILDASGRRAPEFALDAPGNLLPGVSYALFNAAIWDRTMGDINTLTPIASGVVPSIDIRFRNQSEKFAHRFKGYLLVPVSGTYTFRVNVRDNLHLFLGGLEVINTGTGKKLSGPIIAEGTVGLTAGYHAYEARFHASDSNASDWYPLMDLTWAGPGFTHREILPEELFWASGAPLLDFLVSPDSSQLIVPETVNFLPDDPIGTQTFYQIQSGEPLTLNFEAGPTTLPDGEIVSYLWNFGNGAVGGGRTVSQSYAEGTYVLTLTVQTDSGAQFTTGRTIQVLPPPTRINYGRDAGMQVSSNGQFLPTTGAENLFDGIVEGTRWLVNELEGFVEVHFDQDGRRYRIALDEFTMTNPFAWNDRDPKDVVFSGTQDGVNWTVIHTWESIDWQGQTVFTKSFPFPNTTAYSGFRWDIVPQAESPQGEFVELYEIQLFANAEGIQPEIRAPVAAFTVPAQVEKGQPFLLNAGGSVSPDGYPLMYFWDFGDGQTARTISPSISHRYFDEGSREVRLFVRDLFGNLRSAPVQTVNVGVNTNIDPVAVFSVTQQGNLVVFDATASQDPDGDPITYHWNFGDGIASVGQVTSHVYTPGVFSATLVVEDDRGGRATQSQTVDVRPANVPEVVSLNFGDPGQPGRFLHNYEYAGAVPARFWNNVSDGFSGQMVLTSLGTSHPLSLSSSGTRKYMNGTFPVQNGNARMLSTQWFGNGKSGDYTLSQIPYGLYDLYVYFAGTRGTPPQTQRITVNGESKFIRDDTGSWNGILEESTATTQAAAEDGPAYVVFRNLSSASITIALSEMNDYGLSGIQIVNTALNPPAPQNLSATAVSQSRIDLAWTDPTDPSDEFRIERSADGTTVWSTLATLIGTSHSDTGLTGGDTWYYRVITLRGGLESVPSMIASATTPGEPAAPVITTHPQSQNTFVGSNVSFSVIATGNPVPTYQWRKNGVNLSGATDSTLVLTSVPLSAAGTYSVLVSNGIGSGIESDVAVLTVNEAGNLLIYEGFDYDTALTQLNGQAPSGEGLSGTWSQKHTGAGESNVVAGLSFGPLEVSGNAFQLLGDRLTSGTDLFNVASIPVAVTSTADTLWTSHLVEFRVRDEGQESNSASPDSRWQDRVAMFPGQMDRTTNPHIGFSATKDGSITQGRVGLAGGKTDGAGSISFLQTHMIIGKVTGMHQSGSVEKTATMWVLTQADFEAFVADGRTEADLENNHQYKITRTVTDDIELTLSGQHLNLHTIDWGKRNFSPVYDEVRWGEDLQAVTPVASTPPPPPEAPVLDGLVMTGAGQGLRVQTQSVYEYRLEYTDTLLGNPVWLPMTDWIPGNNGQLDFIDTTPDLDQRFYRLGVRLRQ